MDFTLNIFDSEDNREYVESENILDETLVIESESEFGDNSYADPDLDTGDFSKISIAGGDDEEPDDDAIKITAQQYNQAVDQLQKTYKEGMELAKMLKKAMVIDGNDDKYDNYDEGLSITLTDDDE